MAGGAVIGALRVVLGADTAALDKGLKESQSGLSSFGNSVQIGMAAAAAAVTTAAYSIAAAIKHSIESADNLNKMSQSSGVAVEELSKLKYAAELSDVSTEALGKSMGKLSKAMVAAATEGASPAAQAFNAMGISVKNQDGTLRSSSDVLADLAEKFSLYKDGAEKTSLAIQIFGKAGAAMIPLLNAGKEGLQDAAEEAEKFGLVIDKKTAVAAEAFNDNLKRMDSIKQGLYMTITAKLLPSFELLSEQLLEAKKNSDFTTVAAESIAAAIKFVANEVIVTTVALQRLGAEMKAVWDFVNAPWGQWGDAFAKIGEEGRKTDEVMSKLKSSLADVFSMKPADPGWGEQLLGVRAMNKEVNLLGIEWAKTNAPIISAADAQRNAVQKFLDSQAKRIAGTEAEAATVGKTAAQQAYLKTVYEAQAIALANNIPLTAALNTQIAMAGEAAAQAAMKLQAAQIAQQVMSPAEKYAQDLANLQMVYLNTDMTAQTFADRQQQLAEAVGGTWQQAGAQMAGGFAQLAGQFAKSNKDMAKAAQAFGIVEATINTYVAFTKALSASPPPFNYVAAAGVLAAGMAKVIAIKSQSFAAGGFVRGPGTSTSDSIPARLSNGEFVMNAEATARNRPQLEAMNSGGGAQMKPNILNLSVPIVTTRDALRQMFDLANDMFRDGYVLNIKPA